MLRELAGQAPERQQQPSEEAEEDDRDSGQNPAEPNAIEERALHAKGV
jgi:hypothetical protein